MPRWMWPGTGFTQEVPVGADHDGAFGTKRPYDYHTGVDLYCEPGTEVRAVEDGTVISILLFTGDLAGSPWWLPTNAIMVAGDSGTVLYGELQEIETVRVGQRVKAGQLLGHVVQVMKHARTRPMTMLHMELYEPGYCGEAVWWAHETARPVSLRDPTPFLLAARQQKD